ncbi:MAG: hypothetical protein ACFFDK_07570 [Promethearchaeota archaeon]
MEEKIVVEKMEYKHDYHKELFLIDREKEEILNDLVFKKMIALINKSRSYMLGPEKTSAARFISKHYRDVYKILKEIIKKNGEEFE